MPFDNNLPPVSNAKVRKERLERTEKAKLASEAMLEDIDSLLGVPLLGN